MNSEDTNIAGEPAPSTPSVAARAARALIGAANVGWGLFLSALCVLVLTETEPDAGFVALACFVPLSLVQAAAGLAAIARRKWPARAFAVVVGLQVLLLVVLSILEGGIPFLELLPIIVMTCLPAAAGVIGLTRRALREEPQPQKLEPWAVTRDVLGVGNSAFGLGLMLLAGTSLINAGRVTAIVLLFGVVVASLAQIVAGLRLVREEPRGIEILAGAGVAQLMMGMFLASRVPNSEYFLAVAIPAMASALFLMLPGFAPYRADTATLASLVKAAAGAAIALAVVWMFGTEAREVKRSLVEDRLVDECAETGSMEVCGRLGLSQIREGESFEEMLEGRQHLDAVCASGNYNGCRFSGYIRSNTYADFFQDAHDHMTAEVARRSATRCRDGDAEACAVALQFTDEVDNALFERTKQLCRSAPSVACHAWAQHDMSNDEARKLSCKAGFDSHCSRPLRPAEACLDGSVRQCQQLREEAAEAPDVAIYRALATADRPHRDPGLYAVDFPERDYRTACDEGSVPACIAAGRVALGPVQVAIEAPELPPSEVLDATVGKACDEGAALGCLMYGTWLLDRPLDAERDIARANELLSRGCAQGSAVACLLQDFDEQILAGDTAARFDALRSACVQLNDEAVCRPFYSTLAAEIGVTPWPLGDELAMPFFRKACLDGDLASCSHFAWLHSSNSNSPGAIPSLRFAAMDAAGRGCRAGHYDSCEAVLDAASTWWPGYESHLQGQICGQIQLDRCDN